MWTSFYNLASFWASFTVLVVLCGLFMGYGVGALVSGSGYMCITVNVVWYSFAGIVTEGCFLFVYNGGFGVTYVVLLA